MQIDQKNRLKYSKWKGLNGHTYLEELILRYPEKPWNWYHLSRNANISVEFIFKHSRYPWEWNAVSANPNLKIKYVLANRDKIWDWRSISQNPGILPEDVDRHPNLPWDWSALSNNPNIRPEFYERHKDKEWDIIYGLSRNRHFIGKLNYDFSKMSNAEILFLSRVEIVDLDYVVNHPEIPWDWGNYTSSYVKRYGIEKVLETPQLPWKKSQIFSNARIDEKLLSLPDICWYSLSFNPMVTEDLIERHTDKNWYWFPLAQNDNISFEFAERFVDTYNRSSIFRNKNIPKDVLSLKNKKMIWHMSDISLNPYITPEIVAKLSSKIDWNMLSINTFLCDKKMEFQILEDIKMRQKVVSLALEGVGVCSDVAKSIASYASWY